MDLLEQFLHGWTRSQRIFRRRHSLHEMGSTIFCELDILISWIVWLFVTFFSRRNSLYTFFRAAHTVLHLSPPKLWIEHSSVHRQRRQQQHRHEGFKLNQLAPNVIHRYARAHRQYQALRCAKSLPGPTDMACV